MLKIITSCLKVYYNSLSTQHKRIIIYNNMYKNPDITLVICSSVIQLDLDIFFDYIFRQSLGNNVKFHEIAQKMKMSVLFAQKRLDSNNNLIQTGQESNKLEWDRTIKFVIDAIPENIKKMTEHNYYVYKMIEYKQYLDKM